VELPFFIPVAISISFLRILSAKWRTEAPIVAEKRALTAVDGI
jgi:hypothetical protein